MVVRTLIGSVLFCVVCAMTWSLGTTPLRVGASTGTAVVADDFFTVDGAHSSMLFRIRHFEVSNFWGRINKPKGRFRIDDDDLGASFVNVSVELKNMDAGNDSRNALLVGPDFFNAREHSAATFSSKSVKKIADGTYEATGDFTMRGVTKTITVVLNEYTEHQTTKFGFRGGFECVFTVKRSDFGMDMFIAEKTLGDEVRITAAIEGVQR